MTDSTAIVHAFGNFAAAPSQAAFELATSAQRFQKPLNPFKEGYDKDN